MYRDNGSGESAENMENMPPELQRIVQAELEKRQRMHDSVKHFYEGNYVSLNTLEVELAQVSWKGANELVPMVLISKSKRTELGVEVGDVVKVEANGKALPCLVDRQFKTMKDGATVNRIVAYVLGVTARVSAVTGPTDEDGQAVATTDVPTGLGSMLKVSSLI